MEREPKKKKKEPAQKKAKPFRFELGWGGMFGLVTVCFCLFLWMFLLGLWAGQTILLPTGDRKTSLAGKPAQQSSVRAEPSLSSTLGSAKQ